MCGIAGAVDLNGRREFSAARLLAMTGAIAHRGPDDEQFHIEPGLAMGARRLSIVDLAGGRQPISNEDGSIWVTQNGELFEYPELQAELQSRGHRLATRCDTELWAHLYEDLRRTVLRQGPRTVRGGALGSEHADGDPGPRPRGDLPAVLCPGGRLAALGLGGEGAPGLGHGACATGPEGHRPLLQHVLRRYALARSSMGSRRSRRAIIYAFATGGSSSSGTGTSISPTPARNAGSTTRHHWSTSWNS